MVNSAFAREGNKNWLRTWIVEPSVGTLSNLCKIGCSEVPRTVWASLGLNPTMVPFMWALGENLTSLLAYILESMTPVFSAFCLDLLLLRISSNYIGPTLAIPKVFKLITLVKSHLKIPHSQVPENRTWASLGFNWNMETGSFQG